MRVCARVSACVHVCLGIVTGEAATVGRVV